MNCAAIRSVWIERAQEKEDSSRHFQVGLEFDRVRRCDNRLMRRARWAPTAGREPRKDGGGGGGGGGGMNFSKRVDMWAARIAMRLPPANPSA